ncbi:hypothetical protein ABZ608_15080 [Streptomyces sp. NPDC013172]|uniref:hypothetical protein n=1 Tax=Streptomyces sp. NPDC013172 TaxID=3155009 RepID=UPI0033D83EE3
MDTTPQIAVAPSVTDSRAGIWFATPGGFTELPVDVLLAGPDSAEADRLRLAVASLVDALPDGVTRQRFIAQLAHGQQLLRALRDVGTVHCALGIHRDDVTGGTGETLHSLFTVSWRDIAWAPRSVSAARAVATADSHAHVEYLDLPCGPAAMGETVRAPSPGSDLPQTPLLQIHAYLPHPNHRRMAILTLSSPATQRRAQYRAIVRNIAELTSFTSPLGAAQSD